MGNVLLQSGDRLRTLGSTMRQSVEKSKISKSCLKTTKKFPRVRTVVCDDSERHGWPGSINSPSIHPILIRRECDRLFTSVQTAG